MAFLISCAGSKNQPKIHNPSDLQSLSFNDELYQARQELLLLTNIQLDWNRTLPAWQLYSGNRSKIYPRITETNWTKNCIDVQILSALFGANWTKNCIDIQILSARIVLLVDPVSERVELGITKT